MGVQQIVDLIKREVFPKSQERNNNPINLVSAVGRDQWADVFERLESEFLNKKIFTLKFF